ncbi:glutamyl-tRNA(gln)amidotransferase subunit C [Metamycoplasma cloacale]|uniref:Glutamyl-tRNA amidotransferase n=1 Tax=Metamycoplasma cloacale TaxID=92401 RepID=A0A2Z4LLT4_9BACT|nr:Asp-tRNA(Asn)/Glu-tRNA(Gln) amidotransferase subunit GatC [Metamycoplasma cloacale]AWX42644.1 glutamyl-tRNA amidotransferase [Metamycoplasma cloacale]VEU79572.1 glutamyl-tRNA(gln)amidotransferase subunit C [Metamycoplasma cloacale]
MDKEKIYKLANDLLFIPSDDVVAITNELHSAIDLALEELASIDLSNVKPMSHINEKPIDFSLLRKDEVKLDYLIAKKDLLNNASNKDDNFVIMKKVI